MGPPSSYAQGRSNEPHEPTEDLLGGPGEGILLSRRPGEDPGGTSSSGTTREDPGDRFNISGRAGNNPCPGSGVLGEEGPPSAGLFLSSPAWGVRKDPEGWPFSAPCWWAGQDSRERVPVLDRGEPLEDCRAAVPLPEEAVEGAGPRGGALGGDAGE